MESSRRMPYAFGDSIQRAGALITYQSAWGGLDKKTAAELLFF